MTHQAPPVSPSAGADPGRRLAQLREALRLVERIAGCETTAEAGLDEAARLSAAYERGLPVAQRRFDALAEETAIWAAAGVEALLAAGETAPPRAAAARLADTLGRALRGLEKALP